MKILSSEYLKSAPTFKHSPNQQSLSEFAFIGRSNVGKSSLINYLSHKKKLAYVSGSPGKTIYFNYYFINKTHYWVDLPGYGYAKKSIVQREEWNKNWSDFVKNNKNLKHIFLLIDGRIPLQEIDVEMMFNLLLTSVDWSIILTKTEKVKTTQMDGLLLSLQSTLPPDIKRIKCFPTSASQRQGGEAILNHIASLLDNT